MDPFLIAVLALVGLVTFFWIVVLGFQTHIAWGLVCLLVPLGVVVFAIVYWRRAWIPLVLHLATGLLMFQLSMTQVEALLQNLEQVDEQQIMDFQAVETEILNRLESGEMTEQEARDEMARALAAVFSGERYRPSFLQSSVGNPAEFRVERGESSLDKVDIDAKIQAAIEQERKVRRASEPPKPKWVRAWVVADAADASGHIGRTLRVTTTRGQTREGDLIAINDAGELVLEQRLQGGTVSYPITRAQIAGYELWDWVEN